MGKKGRSARQAKLAWSCGEIGSITGSRSNLKNKTVDDSFLQLLDTALFSEVHNFLFTRNPVKVNFKIFCYETFFNLQIL